jgi:hypothetical protein
MERAKIVIPTIKDAIFAAPTMMMLIVSNAITEMNIEYASIAKIKRKKKVTAYLQIIGRL